mgnify:CR=1 FL=1
MLFDIDTLAESKEQKPEKFLKIINSASSNFTKEYSAFYKKVLKLFLEIYPDANFESRTKFPTKAT